MNTGCVSLFNGYLEKTALSLSSPVSKVFLVLAEVMTLGSISLNWKNPRMKFEGTTRSIWLYSLEMSTSSIWFRVQPLRVEEIIF